MTCHARSLYPPFPRRRKIPESQGAFVAPIWNSHSRVSVRYQSDGSLVDWNGDQDDGLGFFD